MNDNPYQTALADNQETTRPRRWMLIVGGVAILTAILCAITTAILLLGSFAKIAGSGPAPKPAELAEGISWATLPTMAIVPLTVVGVCFMILAFVFRESVPMKEDS